MHERRFRVTITHMSDPSPAERLTSVFAPEAAAPRLARHWAHPVLASWGLDGSMADAVVAVSELMTNAIVHGAGDVELSLVRFAGRVRIEVRDHGTGEVTAGRPSSDAPGGRGVHIIGQMARAWGVEPCADGGKTVWAEFDLTK